MGLGGAADLLREGVLAPGLPAVVLGAYMLLGRGWALRYLQVFVLLLVGFTALVAVGLQVSLLASPVFLAPFLAFCLGWWALSQRVVRGAGADRRDGVADVALPEGGPLPGAAEGRGAAGRADRGGGRGGGTGGGVVGGAA